mgnify:CR=1 FL=1
MSDWFRSTPESERLLGDERVILAVTEKFYETTRGRYPLIERLVRWYTARRLKRLRENLYGLPTDVLPAKGRG